MNTIVPLRATWSSRAAVGVLAAVLVLSGCSSEAPAARGGAPEPVLSDRPLPPRGMAWVILGADTVVAEVARTAEERARGLMFREEVVDGSGMLFVFEDEAPRSFWMRNTYIPLDIAFIDAAQRVVDIQQMEPLDEDFTDSRGAAMYALEVRQGWFAEQGIEPGMTARFVFHP